jgi:hypothetical protein
MLWFRNEISPKISCIEGLVPNTPMFRGEALGNLLEHEGSDSISGLGN